MEKHHLYWPKRAFRKSSVAWRFRQLPCHIVMLTHEEHVEVHSQRRASDMPTRDEMLQKLDLCKDCKAQCVPHRQRIDYILNLIDEGLE
jgi:hypothetical protein